MLWFSFAPLRGVFWLRPGDFGVATDSSLRVVGVDDDAGEPAYRAGIHIGDRFDGVSSFEQRLYLQRVRNPAPAERLALHVERENGSSRPVSLVAEVWPFDASDVAMYFPWAAADLVFVLVGSILVLLRPSRMTWAFFLYCMGTAPGIMLGYYWLPAWLVFTTVVFVSILQALGFAAFLVFCVRVPDDRAVGVWRYVESIVAPLVLAGLLICGTIINLSITGVLHAEINAKVVQGAILYATYVVGVLALFTALCRERGMERNRVAWILAGFIIGLGSRVTINLADPGANPYTGLSGSSWLSLIPALEVAIPLTVAYAVIRHQALNVGFVANRTLVYGLFLCAGLTAFTLLDLLATKRFAHNQFEVGLDVAVALAIGLSFQVVHPRAIRLIDRVFLPERYHAAIKLAKLRTTLGHIRNEDGAPNRVVGVLTTELALSSLALFKKMPDGGFVRFAAAGWPKGSSWHIFAEDPLAQSFGSSRRVRSI